MTTDVQKINVTDRLAEKYGTNKDRFYNIVKATCKMDKASNEQFETFLLTAEKYDLNPLMKQMWAYPDRNGGIMTMVALDGWISIVNNHPQFDGYETSVNLDEKGSPISATCTMWRKDKSRPVTKTVYTKEWAKESSPVWKQMPIHFIEMRAYVQCARMCFNIAGLYDADVTPVDLSDKYPSAVDMSATNTAKQDLLKAIAAKKAETVPTTIPEQKQYTDPDTGEVTDEVDPEIVKKAELHFGS